MKRIIQDALILLMMVSCVLGAFALGVGWGFENGKDSQMMVNQNTLASCQELVGKE